VGRGFKNVSEFEFEKKSKSGLGISLVRSKTALLYSTFENICKPKKKDIIKRNYKYNIFK
jgi:hypothetical protein